METSIHQMCRTCLGSGTALVPLYAKQISSATYTVAEMLRNFTTVVVSEHDGLPEKVCLSCVSEINRAYFFKIKCENSEETLQQYLKEIIPEDDGSITVIKEETKILDRKFDEIVPDKTVSIFEDKPSPAENEDDFLAEQMAEILSEEDHELIEINDEVEDENEDNDGHQETYELSDYTDSNYEDEARQAQTKLIILACEDCFNTFESKEEFEAHSAVCLKESGNDTTDANMARSKELKKCPICPMDFVHQKNLDKHIKKCHPVFTETNVKIKTDDSNASNDDDSLTKPTDTIDKSDDEDDNEDDEEKDEVRLIEISHEDALLRHDPSILPCGEFTCIRCGAGFAKKKSLDCHMKINKCTQEQFSCKICKRVFINDLNLLEHLKSHESNNQCKVCSKTFSNQEKLQSHTKKVHKEIVKNQCKFCGKAFSMLSTLKDHLRTHSGEKPFLCSICGKGFSQNTNLKQHVMRHNNLKPFACNQCECSFVSKGELNAHIRKHTGDHPFSCDMCGSSFTTSSSLVKHKRIHTGERPYACEFCPMRFSALGTLKNHRRTHTGEKPFKCEYCSRSFAQKSDCVTHLRSHTGERPYICSICGWCFQQSGILKTHMKTHEGGKIHDGKMQKPRARKVEKNEMEEDILMEVE